MKVCSTCGESYQDYVDFCFNDGEVLVEAETGAVSPSLTPGMEFAPTRRRQQPSPESLLATPVPRERSQLGDNRAATPVPLQDEEDDEGIGPSAESLAMTQPIDLPNGGRPAAASGGDATAPMQRPQGASPTNAPPTSGPLIRATTFESEVEEPESSRILLFGVAAALFGVFLLVSAGVVLVGTTSGMFGGEVAGNDPVPLPTPTPTQPTPPPVSSVQPMVAPPPVPEPVVEPDPVTPDPVEPAPVAPVAVAPVPEPVAPAPVVPAPAAPTPTPAPVPVAPVPQPVRPTPQPAPPTPVAPDPVAVVEVQKVDVSVRSEPSGASVFVGGSMVLAATPGTIQLDPGDHVLEARLKNHVAARQSVHVEPGASANARFTLEPEQLVSVLLMWSGPTSDYPTSATIDGVPLSCPIPCTSPISVGSHTMKFFSKDGRTFQQTLTVPPGNVYRVTIQPTW
ncbi:MAG: PEGA domain-containing protein [Myxococcales bacterium]|nr:PEGA domain-containing protein [Myxococcales bacterium]